MTRRAYLLLGLVVLLAGLACNIVAFWTWVHDGHARADMAGASVLLPLVAMCLFNMRPTR